MSTKSCACPIKINEKTNDAPQHANSASDGGGNGDMPLANSHVYRLVIAIAACTCLLQ